MTTDAQTISVYDSKTEEYATQCSAESDPYLQRFIKQMPEAGKVLDLGCGPGHVSAVMKSAGLQPDAVDASAEMVKFAADHYGVTARLASFDDIDAVRKYDGIWANFSLLHAPRKKLPAYLKSLHEALVPGGLLHLAMKKGTGEGRDDFGRYYIYLDADELTELLHAAGFSPGQVEEDNIRGFAGNPDVSLTVLAHA